MLGNSSFLTLLFTREFKNFSIIGFFCKFSYCTKWKFPWNLYEMPQLRRKLKKYIHLSNVAKYMWNNINLFLLNWVSWIHCSFPEVPIFNESLMNLTKDLLVICHLYSTYMPA